MKTSSKSHVSMLTMAVRAAIVFCLFACIAALFIGCTSTQRPAEYEAKPTGTIMRVAHRGGAALAPENTLAAFANGLKTDADALELDIHLSKDGVLMVAHDPLLQRTTGESGEIIDYEAAVLRTMNAAKTHPQADTFGFQPIPTLEEVLKLAETAPRPVLLQIEIKVKQDGTRYENIEKKLVEMLRNFNRIDSSIIISFDFPSLATIKQLEPKLKTGALISKAYMTKIGAKGPKAVAEDIASLGADYVGINQVYLSQTLYDEFRAKGLKVGVWTVNEPQAIEKFAAMNVDFITSDRPDLLKELLDK